ncbi:AP-4 complex subunit epsilon-1-like [Eurytemora carolleeae]|uniref:AP-4 complex subunit epsilon-1-like n=1 Tax=Eurytemora carolleeae TaxID=1294199 RepID=UPI000C78D976|nr:AP-4 complex subunit epsilon-1-like [Eurytemora carolleeae]|eukprot:XP_023338724.1 AP-4 complex subunit epsilon-1-like [Eurytemora affinis]
MNNYFRKCGKMSEILQKTFNVLVGSGEGVGWGSPTSSNPHSLSGSLAATLRQLALAPLKEEKELCRVQIENCVSILSNPETSPSTTAECLVKGMFIQLMGQDASGLQIYAVKMAQASSLLHRKLGYLASSILIPNSSELLLLLTNCVMRDICSKSVPSILTGLIAACNLICDNSILSLLTDKVIQLVNYKNHLVRNKALITLDRFCYIREPDPEIGLVGLSPVLHVHQQIIENRLPKDFTYRYIYIS